MIARSIVDAAAWARRDIEAYSIVVSAYQQRRLVAGEIQHGLGRLSRQPRRNLMLAAAADAEIGVHSELEGLLVNELRGSGLPVPQLQFKRRDTDGRLRYLDGYYVEWRVHLEVDGAGHLGQSGYWADMKRQNALWIAGDRVLRFPARAIRYEMPTVISQVRMALIAAGWRP